MATEKLNQPLQDRSPIMANPAPCVVFIDECGLLVSEDRAKYKVLLQGSYQWSWLDMGWWYLIKSIEPKIPLSRVLSREMLFVD
jgi:hypothetical protein